MMMGTPKGLFIHRTRISLTWEWEETRFRGWRALARATRERVAASEAAAERHAAASAAARQSRRQERRKLLLLSALSPG